MLKGDCNKCIHKDLSVYSNTCMRCGISRKNYTPKTNRDRLRAMTNEELAEFLGENDSNFPIGDHKKEWLDWLRQEAKE